MNPVLFKAIVKIQIFRALGALPPDLRNNPHYKLLVTHPLCSLYSSPKNIQALAKHPRGHPNQLSKSISFISKKFNAILKGGKRKAPKAERETPNTAACLHKWQLIAKCAGLPFQLATLRSFFKLA